MRRTSFMALLAALVLAPSAHAAGTTQQILRDCIDDGVLQGHYTQAELRKAAANLPTDVDEYSDCGGVLSRALQNGDPTKSDDNDSSNSSGGATGGGGGSSNGGNGGGTSDPGTPAGTPAPTATPAVTPTTP